MGSNFEPEFSFDTHDGLNDELDAAFERAQRGDAPIEVAAERLVRPISEYRSLSELTGAVVRAVDDLGAKDLPGNERIWIVQQLMRAFEGWWVHESACRTGHLTREEGMDPTALFDSPDLLARLSSLYRANQAIAGANIKTPDNGWLEDTMEIVLVPWGAMERHAADGTFFFWLQGMYDASSILGGRAPQLELAPEITSAVQNGDAVYRYTNQWGSTGTTLYGRALGMRESEGAWGIMLAQTSTRAGVDGYTSQNLMQYSDGHQHELILAGHRAGNLGLAEWAAITLQVGALELSANDTTLLVANSVALNQSGWGMPASCVFAADSAHGRANIRRLYPTETLLTAELRPVIFSSANGETDS